MTASGRRCDRVGLPARDRYKVMRGDAERLLNFIPAPIQVTV
jgi:hypothetical protein